MNEELTYHITFSKLMILLIAVGVLSGVAVFWLLYSFVFPYNAQPVTLDTLQRPTRPAVVGDVIPMPVENSKARVFVQSTRRGDYVLPGDVVSVAFAITSDGWFITSFPASYQNQLLTRLPSLKVMDENNQIGDIEDYVYDEMTGLYFIKTTLLGLSPIDISFDSIIAQGDLLGVECTDTRYLVRNAGTKFSEYEHYTDAVSSSESLGRRMNIHPEVSLIPGCIVYDDSQQIVGIAADQAGDISIVPGYHIATHITDILRDGVIKRPYMGVSYLNLFNVLPLDSDWGSDASVVLYGVNAVRRNSPAENAGLQAGDIIDRINNEKTSQHKDLAEIVQEYYPGDMITVVFIRDGERQETVITLE